MPAKKSSPWITHVKQEAVRLKIKFGEALGDPRVKKSYKK